MNKYDSACVTFARGAWHPRRGMPWPRRALWGGLICENITQAVSADILRCALENLRKIEYDQFIVGHTHDEVLLEVPAARARGSGDDASGRDGIPAAMGRPFAPVGGRDMDRTPVP